MKKILSVSVIILSVDLCMIFGTSPSTYRTKTYTSIEPRQEIVISPVEIRPTPVYTGGNMTAPKDVEFEEEIIEEDYDLYAGFSDEDITLMAAIVYYEAGHQCMEGRQYVVDVILNRLDDKRFPDSVVEVLSAPKQFSTYKKACSLAAEDIPIECYGAVIAEIHNRLSNEVLYFSSEGYNGKTPLFKCGDHYFSK